MFELMTVQPAVQNASDDPLKLFITPEEADITFEDVVFQYVEGKDILKGLTFTVCLSK